MTLRVGLNLGQNTIASAASASTQASDSERLPAEIWTAVFQCFENLSDFLALASVDKNLRQISYSYDSKSPKVAAAFANLREFMPNYLTRDQTPLFRQIDPRIGVRMAALIESRLTSSKPLTAPVFQKEYPVSNSFSAEPRKLIVGEYLVAIFAMPAKANSRAAVHIESLTTGQHKELAVEMGYTSSLEPIVLVLLSKNGPLLITGSKLQKTDAFQLKVWNLHRVMETEHSPITPMKTMEVPSFSCMEALDTFFILGHQGYAMLYDCSKEGFPSIKITHVTPRYRGEKFVTIQIDDQHLLLLDNQQFSIWDMSAIKRRMSEGMEVLKDAPLNTVCLSYFFGYYSSLYTRELQASSRFTYGKLHHHKLILQVCSPDPTVKPRLIMMDWRPRFGTAILLNREHIDFKDKGELGKSVDLSGKEVVALSSKLDSRPQKLYLLSMKKQIQPRSLDREIFSKTEPNAAPPRRVYILGNSFAIVNHEGVLEFRNRKLEMVSSRDIHMAYRRKEEHFENSIFYREPTSWHRAKIAAVDLIGRHLVLDVAYTRYSKGSRNSELTTKSHQITVYDLAVNAEGIPRHLLTQKTVPTLRK